MTTTASETGALAADGVADVLAGAGNEIEAQLGAASWAVDQLDKGGWAALTAAGSGAELTLRDIQQVARVAGRYAVPNALAVSLLAGRWFDLDEVTLGHGATFPVARDDKAVLPYAVAGVRTLDADGRECEHEHAERDEFSLLLPVLTVERPAVAGQQQAEFEAVLAATATGCADAVLERSVSWVQTREQFGQPLKAFQALRHHLADMHIAREEAWTCAIAAGEEPQRAEEWSRIALMRAKSVIETGIQVHGGIGFTWEAGLHHWLRHVLQLATLTG